MRNRAGRVRQSRLIQIQTHRITLEEVNRGLEILDKKIDNPSKGSDNALVAIAKEGIEWGIISTMW